MSRFIGLDFGTSNSTVSYREDGKAKLIKLERQFDSIPSAIFFDLEEDETVFGRDAISRYTDGEHGRLMRSLKSILGSSLVEEQTTVGKRTLSFEQILGLFLHHLKRTAENQLGEEVDQVVLGRPVHFVDHDGEADRHAQSTLEKIAKTQGFRDVEFELEPVAAALHFARQATQDACVLVVDIGGGTADFTIVDIAGQTGTHKQADVRSTAGIHIGGGDFDRALSLARFMPLLGYKSTFSPKNLRVPNWPYVGLATWHLINNIQTKQCSDMMRNIERQSASPDLIRHFIEVITTRKGHYLAGKTEDAKIELSQHSEFTVRFENLSFPDLLIPSSEFDEATSELVDALRSSCLETIKLAGRKPPQVDVLLLTGGTSQIPAVRNMLLKAMPGAEIVENEIFSGVGLGLAHRALETFG